LQGRYGSQEDAQELSQISSQIKALRGYATGTSFVTSSGAAIVDDDILHRKELIIHKPSQGRLTSLEYGDGVLDGNLTNSIMNVATNPQKFIADQLSKMQFSSFANITPNNINAPTISMPITIEGNADMDTVKALQNIGDSIANKAADLVFTKMHNNSISGGYMPPVIRR
jgi:hypothetical protein